MLPRDQEVLIFEEQGLGDDIFMSSQSVQPTLIDDVPHDHICVLRRQEKVTVCLMHAVTNTPQTCSAESDWNSTDLITSGQLTVKSELLR